MLQQPLMMLQRIIDWSSQAPLLPPSGVFEVMDTPVDIDEMPPMQSRCPKDRRAPVKFTDVHFGYDKAARGSPWHRPRRRSQAK